MENKLSLGIDELDLDVRTFSALKRAGVNTIADIEAQAEQLAETIPARQWKHITDALNTYKGIPMPGSLVEENILGDELTFDEIAKMVGEIIILDRSTESRNWYKAVKVEDVFVSNDDHRHLRYYDGAKQRGIIDEMYFDKSQRSPQRAWRVKPQDMPAEPPAAQSSSDTSVFDYSELDSDTAAKLESVTAEIFNVRKDYIFTMAKKVAYAHELLANHYGGKFGVWCESIGISRDTGNNLVRVAEIFGNLTADEQKNLSQVKPSLLYEAAKPSAPPKLVEQVMNGDITTHKEYIRLKKELEEAQEKAAFWNKANTATNEENQKLRAERVNAMNRADNAERELSEAQAKIEKLNREADEADREYDAMADRECHYETEICELEQRIKELENRPVDVAVDVDELNRRVAEVTNKMNSEMEHTLAEERRGFADTLNAKDDRIWELEDELAELRDHNTELDFGDGSNSLSADQLSEIYETLHGKVISALKDCKAFISINNLPQIVKDRASGKFGTLKELIEWYIEEME